ncbi:DNA-directed RNA polymerase subunit L [Methanocella sp. CWC-04]|uniref:DNA-directed RNA polymerase subunit Rpo11 n=1 Tax=Methanooceanicella nereidis TaxID=2052831 RepID=A0AAP2W6T1_9EURY|nr:DNA-directed RNA polymerase subunit L [Methanocella sp. CWC-04]MCD1295617.1 DNA-directed RNA polymerase subunit L [Methanocella sp. CWC-04]
MEIKILNKTDTEIEIEIKGEDHTLLNALKSALLMDKAVKIATYDIEFTGISDPVLFVKTDKTEDPIDAVRKASKKLSSDCDEFIKTFSDKSKA